MQKRILVINGHPYEDSFVAVLFNAFIENLNPTTFDIKKIELGKMKFDPVLRFGYSKKMEEDKEIILSQKLLEWADHIVFFYPVWWGSMPSLLKGWLDRVLTPGYAFSMNGLKVNKLLKGKTAELFLTSDAPEFYIRYILNSPIRVMKKYILGFCGIKVIKSTVFPMITLPNREKARAKFIDNVIKKAIRMK